jgi:hypothetical protein
MKRYGGLIWRFEKTAQPRVGEVSYQQTLINQLAKFNLLGFGRMEKAVAHYKLHLVQEALALENVRLTRSAIEGGDD